MAGERRRHAALQIMEAFELFAVMRVGGQAQSVPLK